jgi:1,4-alpha-glucan branching enzyme
MITKEPGNGGTIRVTFSIPASIWADTIHLVGDFNNWSTTATPLKLDETRWSVALELEAGRAYHYRYLMNGTDWSSDWSADHVVAGEQRSDHSVVVTQLGHESSVPWHSWQRTGANYNCA